MPQKRCSTGKRSLRQDSFSLVELLVVMAIIAILAALTLGAATGVMQHAARERALSEIAAMRTGLDSYKIDNGGYPVSEGVLLLTNTYASSDGSGNAYQTNAEILYQALSGKVHSTDTTLTGKAYINFRSNQTGSVSAGSYVIDPWSLAYGYSSGTTNNAPSPSYPYNGSGSYDLWSTGGKTLAKWTTTPSLTNAWITSWQ